MSQSKPTKTAGRKAKSGGASRAESKRAEAAALSEEEEEDPDDPMQEGVLYEVQSIIGKRRKANRLEYEVQWSGFPRATWEPASNLVHCKPLVDRFNNDTAAEEAALQQQGQQTGGKAHKPSATHSPQAKLPAETSEEAPSSQSSKGAGVVVESVLPHGHKRERKKAEHYEPVDPTVERALRQEEHISKLSDESKSKKQKTSKGAAAAAAAGQGEEEAGEFVEGEDVFEIQSIVGKKREGGKTFYLCKWAPTGNKIWEDTYEPEENIFAKDLITEFNERTKKGKRRKTVAGGGASAEVKSVSSGSEISPSQPTPSQPSQPSQPSPPAQPAQTTAAAASAAAASTASEESPANIGVISDDEADVDVVMVSSTVVTTLEDSPAPEPATATVPAGADWSDPSEQTAQLAPLPLAPKSGAESLEAPTVTATVTMVPGTDAVFVSVQQSEDTDVGAAAAADDSQVDPLASSLADDPSTLAPSFEATGEMISVAAAESKAASPPPPQPQPQPSSPSARSPQHHAPSPSSSQDSPKKHGIMGAISSVLHSVLGGGAEHSEAKQQQEGETMQ